MERESHYSVSQRCVPKAKESEKILACSNLHILREFCSASTLRLKLCSLTCLKMFLELHTIYVYNMCIYIYIVISGISYRKAKLCQLLLIRWNSQ